MKKCILFILCLIGTIAYGQNTFKYELRANGGLRVGGSTFAEIDSITLQAGKLRIMTGATLQKIAGHVLYTDTATMLTKYARKASPTFSGIAKLNTDTLATQAYARTNGGSGTPIDTTSLSSRIDLKLNVLDTADMLSPYALLSEVGEGGSMTYPGAGIPLSTGSAWGTSITNNSTEWNKAGVVGNGTAPPYFDGSSDGGQILTFYGDNGFWTALQGGAPTANRSYRLPIAALPSAGTTSLMNIDEYGNMGFAFNGLPATLTATELGYSDGVTSSIQNQLNAKVNASDTAAMLAHYALLSEIGTGGDISILETRVDSIVDVLKDSVNVETLLQVDFSMDTLATKAYARSVGGGSVTDITLNSGTLTLTGDLATADDVTFYTNGDGQYDLPAGGGNLTIQSQVQGWISDSLANMKAGVFNVLDYGAVGDGITDNSTALQAAVNAAVNSGIGGIVVVPADGIFAYSTTLDMSYCRGITLQGQTNGLEAGGSTLHFTGSGDAIKMSSDETPSWWLGYNRIKDLRIYGNGNCTNLIYARYVGNLILSNLYLKDCTDKAIYMVRSITTHLDNIEIREGTTIMDYGIFLDSLENNSQTSTIITMPYVKGTNEAGIYIGNTIGTKIIGGAVEGNYGWGLVLSDDATYTSVDNLDFESNVIGGIHVLGRMNTFESCYGSDSLRVNGNLNIFKNLINTDDFVLSTDARQNLIDHCAVIIIDSSKNNDYFEVQNPVTGTRLFAEDTAYGIMNMNNYTSASANFLNLNRRTNPGTAGSPSGLAAIKFGFDPDRHRSSSRIGAVNEVATSGGSWLYLQTYPRTWTDSEASYINTLRLDPNGNATFYNDIFSSNGSDTVSTLANLRSKADILDVRLLADTIPIFVFGAGGGMPTDTATFQNGVIAGAFYNSGSDTLKITSLRGVLAEGTGTETIGVQVSWHATFKSASAVNLNSSAYTITSITTGDEDTSFANDEIPPGVWVWCTLSGASANNKPTLLSLTMSGYKIPIY